MTSRTFRGLSPALLGAFLGTALLAGCDAPTAKLPPRYFPMAAVATTPAVAGPIESESTPDRQQHWLVPGAAGLLQATLYRPAGPGPFPLVILAPDGPADPATARRLADPMKPAARWFAGHGYAALVVVPRAFGTGGTPIEAVADDLDAAYGYLRGQSFVDAGRIVLAGEGTGGFAALALSARQPTGVLAAVNFDGRPTPDLPGAADMTAAGGDDEVDLLGSSSTPLKLEPAAKAPPAKIVMPVSDPALAALLRGYGEKSHRPELWLYGTGEGAQAKRMLVTFNRAGSAPARLVDVPVTGGSAHAIADQPTLWGEPVAKFLDGLRASQG